jgi:hypothetical protein
MMLLGFKVGSDSVLCDVLIVTHTHTHTRPSKGLFSGSVVDIVVLSIETETPNQNSLITLIRMLLSASLARKETGFAQASSLDRSQAAGRSEESGRSRTEFHALASTASQAAQSAGNFKSSPWMTDR